MNREIPDRSLKCLCLHFLTVKISVVITGTLDKKKRMMSDTKQELTNVCYCIANTKAFLMQQFK